MAPRTFWKGYLKLSLVTCPVAMTPATNEGDKVRFHTLNRKTGARVVSQYIDEVSGKPVDDEAQAKGYARGENEFVLIEDEELEAVRLESTRTIDIETFVPADSVAWIWYDRPHYLTPDDPVGEQAFSVIREAMRATDTAGVAKLVLYGRERAVLLKPRGQGLVVWTLRFSDEVRDADAYLPKLGAPKIDKKALDLIKVLIDERTKPWSADMARDPVQAKLREIIAAKKRKRKAPAVRPAKHANGAPTGGNVINIMDALRKSIASDGKTKRR